jgi:hypothetical protein
LAIVTFTTDFGSHDGYAGAMKGVVLSLAPGATLVDITHDVPRQDVMAGAIALAQAAPLFPRGTIHVAVVDPGVGTARADLVIEAADGSLFVGPDNGLLSLAAAPPRRAHRIESPAFMRRPVSPTFHGRDVFAPAAGRLAAGARAADAGAEMAGVVDLAWPAPRRLDAGPGGVAAIEGTVIHVDAFGNLVTSLGEDAIPRDRAVEIEVEVEVDGTAGAFRAPLATTFADVEPGALVAYVGSMGLLEIAVRDGSAASHIGAARGSAVRLWGRT